jgi:hypothetical protein
MLSLTKGTASAVPHVARIDEGFTGCGKTLVLYQGTTLVGP